MGLSFRPHALVAQGIEHRFPKPFRGVLRTKGKRLKPLLCLRFRLSTSRIISHVFTPLAAQVRPKHGPEIPPRQVTRFMPAQKPASRSDTESNPCRTFRAEAPSSNIDRTENDSPSQHRNPDRIATVFGQQGELHSSVLSYVNHRQVVGLPGVILVGTTLIFPQSRVSKKPRANHPSPRYRDSGMPSRRRETQRQSRAAIQGAR